MRLTVLGMYGPYPAPFGACSGYLLDTGTEKLCFDLGSGSLSVLTGLTAPEELDALIFSHWHNDHSSDLLPLIYRLADARARGCRPLKVYGPYAPDMPTWQAAQNNPCIEYHALAAGDTLIPGKAAELTVLQARHPVPALMYRLAADGKTLAFTGDTNTTPDLPALADQADLLLADGLFTRDTWAENKPHLSAALCAQLARDAGAKRLVITHLHPDIDQDTLLKEAREACPAVTLAYCGAVYEF